MPAVMEKGARRRYFAPSRPERGSYLNGIG
jgi:hypothetical protein